MTDSKNIKLLKYVFRKVKNEYPFQLNAIVILPDHLHCLWQLPVNDCDFSIRWRLIKRYFSMNIPAQVNHRKEKEVWQRRFWEHSIRNESDWNKHMDYIHYNPVKHGYVKSVKDWRHSSFHNCVLNGIYEAGWGSEMPKSISGLNGVE